MSQWKWIRWHQWSMHNAYLVCKLSFIILSAVETNEQSLTRICILTMRSTISVIMNMPAGISGTFFFFPVGASCIIFSVRHYFWALYFHLFKGHGFRWLCGCPLYLIFFFIAHFLLRRISIIQVPVPTIDCIPYGMREYCGTEVDWNLLIFNWTLREWDLISVNF